MEKSLDLIKNNGKEVAWLFFIGRTNQPKVFEKTHPKEYKENIDFNKTHIKKKRMNTNLINDCFKNWNKKENKFLDLYTNPQERLGRGHSKCMYPKKFYSFNLNPFFKMLEIDNIKLTKQQKNIISFIFDDEDIRKNMYMNYKDIGFTEAIIKYYIKLFYIPVLRYKSKEMDIFKRFKLKVADKVITDYLLEQIINTPPKKEKNYLTNTKFNITGDKRILTDKHPSDEITGNMSFKVVSISKTKIELIHFKQTEMRYIYYKLYNKYFDEVNDLNLKMLRAGRI